MPKVAVSGGRAGVVPAPRLYVAENIGYWMPGRANAARGDRVAAALERVPLDAGGANVRFG